MAEVTVPLRRACDEGFPAICAITGTKADGAISIRVGRSLTSWRGPKIRIPLSEPVFVKWARRRNLHIKARGVASVFTALAVVFAFRSASMALAAVSVAVAVHLVDLWAERTSGALEPTIMRRGNDLVITEVHQRFASAARDSL